MKLEDFKIIQGGMGIHVSSWKLAKAVSQKGQLGVVSGTAIDTVVARVLQMGDKDGCIRHALDHFPLKDMAQRVKDRFFQKSPILSDFSFKGIGMPNVNLGKAKTELLIVANFVEVFLAKENHDGWVGINYLEKIQIPTLPSLFGAMLAGVNVVLMGAGIPSSIPGILDDLAQFDPVSLKLYVENAGNGEDVMTHFDPNEFLNVNNLPTITRPAFLAIVSSDIVAKSMERKATGIVNGYVVENYKAGGHNAPPRKDRTLPDNGMGSYGTKDDPDLEKIQALGKPFWLAGQFSEPGQFKQALAAGATGVQVGTPFAFCSDSGMREDVRQQVVKESLAGTLKVETSFRASPTGYPFKLVHLSGEQFSVDNLKKRSRVCDMGYLRTLVRTDDDKLLWRCPAEPVDAYVSKGGTAESCEGRLCLCNGLASTAGYGQMRKQDRESVMITSGEDVVNLARFVKSGATEYSAHDVIEHILG